MAKRSPKPTKETTFKAAVDTFLTSEQHAEDYMALLVAFSLATRPDAGLHYDIIQRILEEKIN